MDIMLSKNRPLKNAGFLGLIAILLTAALIAWWAVYYSPLAPGNGSAVEKRSIGIDAIEDAKEAKQLIEQRSIDFGQ